MKRPLHRSAGTSTVEFLVVAIVIVPLFIAMPLVGKYLDLMHSTEIASRYVAFEGTIANTASSWKSDASLAAEVRRRFFSTSDAPIKTNDVAGDFDAHRNPLWTDHRGDPLLAQFNADVSVTTEVSSNSAPAAAVFAGSSGFSLPQNNQYRATVTVRPRNVAGFVPFDQLGLVMSRNTTILVDPWAAPDNATVKSKVENAGFAAYPIAPLALIGATLGQAPKLVLDPGMDVNNIDTEIVPNDRLQP